jgi:predicted regulator of Ras-like GTPase activity (Roadblock/LC7/MglB family)
MVPGKPAQILEVLRKMKQENPDLEALAVVSLDGLPISSLLPEGAEEDRIAALSATILSLGERASEELKKGKLEQTYVKGTDGYILVTGIKDLAALLVVTNKNAKLGMVMLSIKKGIGEIEGIL